MNGLISHFLLGFPVILLLVVSQGCPDPVSSAANIPLNWVEVAAGTEFSLMAPPETRFQPGKGKDSFVGTFEAPFFTLHFIYGFFSDPLDKDSADPDYEARDVRISGHLAKIVTYYSPHSSTGRPYFIGVHFPAIKKSAVGTTKLTVTCTLEKKEDYAILENIYRTISFK